MQTLLILQTKDAQNPDHIVEWNRTHQLYTIETVYYESILGFIGTKIQTTETEVDLEKVDKIWIEYDWQLSEPTIDYRWITKLIIVKYGHKIALNRETFKLFHPQFDDKLFNASFMNFYQLSHPETQLLSEEAFATRERAVVKKRYSGWARDVYLVSGWGELSDAVRARPQEYICQDYIDIVKELRVVVYKDKVASSVVRSCKFPGGKTGRVKVLSEFKHLVPEHESMCLEVARHLKSQLVGIDLAIDSAGNAYIIEFNIGASLGGFREMTGIDLLARVLSE